jgi:hypothetical protein
VHVLHTRVRLVLLHCLLFTRITLQVKPNEKLPNEIKIG